MSNRLWPLLLVFLSIASIVLASSEKPEIKIDVSGTWKWTMQRQNGGGREVRLKLEQREHHLLPRAGEDLNAGENLVTRAVGSGNEVGHRISDLRFQAEKAFRPGMKS